MFTIEAYNIAPEQTAGVAVADDAQPPEKKSKANGQRPPDQKKPRSKEPVGTSDVRAALAEVLNKKPEYFNSDPFPSGPVAQIKLWREETYNRLSELPERTQQDQFTKACRWMKDNRIVGTYNGFAWLVPKRAAEERMEDFPDIEDVETRPDTVASVAFMITKAARQQLYDLGYSKDAVDNMTPQQANEILDNKG